MAGLQCLKDILVALTEEGKDEPGSALAYALALAKAAGAHLTVEAASTKLKLTHALVSATAAGLVAVENRRIRDLAQAVANKIQSDAAMAEVATTVETRHLSRPQLIDAIAAQARLHDLCILDGELNATDFDRRLIEAILLSSGRPAIIVPPGWAGFLLRTVLIAWDGSASATRAIHDALPFLQSAERVCLVSIVGEKDLSKVIPAAKLAQHLANHAIATTTESIPALKGNAGEALRKYAVHANADLIVMGAFVHARLRQWVLGGVTQSMLKRSNIPILMAH